MSKLNCLVLGGSRYFGKRLVYRLLQSGHSVTVANRGQTPDDFGFEVQRMIIDRDDPSSLKNLASKNEWDLVYDQICYDSNGAQSACLAFEGRVGRFIHTSTGSVYTQPGLRDEKKFDPFSYEIKWGDRSDFEYGEGKRQAEAVYFQKAKFPVVAMRIPIVLGEDDYTGRLEFHIDRIKKGQPIVIPNLKSETTFISSAETAQFLEWLGTSSIKGPLNGCSNGAISIGEIIEIIEKELGKKAELLSNGNQSDYTPFVDEDSRMNDNTLAIQSGFEFEEVRDWFTPLVHKLSSKS